MSATVSKLTKARNLIEKQKGARYAKNMSNKITHELMNLINHKSNNFIQAVSSMNNGTMFVYRINPNKRILMFENLKIKNELKGKQILSQILDIIEPICDFFNYTIQITDFVNYKLAKYFKDKRGYQIFNLNTEISNSNELTKLINYQTKNPKNGFPDTINKRRIPDWAQRKPKKLNLPSFKFSA